MTPPLVKGGQGRSVREVRESASVLGWLIMLAVACIIASAAVAGGGR